MVRKKAASKSEDIKKFLFPIGSLLILLLLTIIFIYRTYQRIGPDDTDIIEADLDLIEKKLNEIDQACSILEFRYDRNFVDFLTVKEFVGSEVGPINLAYPKNWHGPYLKENPSFKGKPYEVIRSKDGYYITPPQEVTLPNNFVIGKDILISHDHSIGDMLKKGGKLNYKERPLARLLKFTIGDWPVHVKKEKIKADASDDTENVVDKIFMDEDLKVALLENFEDLQDT